MQDLPVARSERTPSIDSIGHAGRAGRSVRTLGLGALLGSVLVAGLAGCSTIKDPTFNVVGVSEGERTGEALVLNFTIQADNPNAEPLPLKEASYALTLNDVEVFSGQRDAQVTLRRYGSHTFTLPAVVPADRFDLASFDAGASAEGVRYDLTGTVQYLAPGALAEVLFDTGVRRPKAGVDERGTIDLGG